MGRALWLTVLLYWVPIAINVVVLFRALDETSPAPPPATVLQVQADGVDVGDFAAREAELERLVQAARADAAAAPGGAATATQFAEIRNRALIDPAYVFDGECKFLRTEGCTPYGSVHPSQTAGCHDEVSADAAGLCQCQDGRLFGKSCTTQGRVFCAQVCVAQKPPFPRYTELAGEAAAGEAAAAAFVMLAPSRKYHALCRTVKSLLRVVSDPGRYPLVLIHDPQDKFTEPLRRGVKRAADGADVKFFLASKHLYNIPASVNTSRITLTRYGVGAQTDSLVFRQQARYMTGMFHQEPFLEAYEYIMKIDVGVIFLCNVPFDPFVLMKQQRKVVGFSLMYHDFAQAMPSLPTHVASYHARHRNAVSAAMLAQLVRGGVYSGCSFGASFVVVATAWLRSAGYAKLFDELDASSGFFVERWPYYSALTLLAAALAAPEGWYYFESIGVSTPNNGFHLPDDLRHCKHDPVPQRVNPGMNDWRHPCLQSFAQFAQLRNFSSDAA
eukprot:TRINITY_DN2690_c0_g3_i2.p1 TRINITY_DN2690_c0_g3~~TRINITY_DN2690_c0_g3_i2.p1  ORF type:complete len:500 (+),score=161.01 TRINITY_DN2690_c0_g3_i2:87-1586(+)